MIKISECDCDFILHTHTEKILFITGGNLVRTKTKSRICTGLVTFALAAVLMGGSVMAATESAQVTVGDSDSAKITGTVSLGDKGAVKKNQYYYTYAATLRGTAWAATSGYVSIDGAVDIKLSLDKGKRTYAVKGGTSKKNWISVSAYLNGVGSSGTKKIVK